MQSVRCGKIDRVQSTHVLVASVCKNNDRERCKNLDRALDMYDVDIATRGQSVAGSEVVNHKNDQITNGNKCDD